MVAPISSARAGQVLELQVRRRALFARAKYQSHGRPRTMRGNAPLLGTVRGLRLSQQPSYICRQCRAIQISAAPSTEAPKGGAGGDVFGSPIGSSRDMAGEVSLCI